MPARRGISTCPGSIFMFGQTENSPKIVAGSNAMIGGKHVRMPSEICRTCWKAGFEGLTPTYPRRYATRRIAPLLSFEAPLSWKNGGRLNWRSLRQSEQRRTAGTASHGHLVKNSRLEKGWLLPQLSEVLRTREQIGSRRLCRLLHAQSECPGR